jgi:SAM-dependent methyltransferase
MVNNMDNMDNVDNKNIDYIYSMSPKQRRRAYKKHYEQEANWTIDRVNDGTVHELYHYDKELGTWNICTFLFTYPKLYEDIVSLKLPTSFSNGADIGFGNITFFDWIDVENPILIDISQAHCNFMGDKGWKTMVGNIEDLSLNDNSMDVIVCSDILEHVLSFSRAISEVNRVLKQDGLLLVNVPWKQTKMGHDGFPHLRTFNESNLYDRFSNWDVLHSRILPKTRNPNGIATINLIMRNK